MRASTSPKLAFPGIKESSYQKYHEQLVRADISSRRVNKLRSTPLQLGGAKITEIPGLLDEPDG